MNIKVNWDSSWENELYERLEEDGPWSSWDLYKLAIESAQNLLVPEFEGLQAPKHLHGLQPLPHQLEVARQVVENMNGKAILADEVGLGKTIEAGLILKEYMIRGLVKKVLILVPASLVSQWAYELINKFSIPAVVQRKQYVWDSCDVIVSSMDTAKRNPHRDIIYAQEYDMIIVDEAHKLKNNKTKNYEFVQNLKKKFCLLLTATPIQNKVDEIFHLVSLLKPGHLGNASNFTQKYKGRGRQIYEDEHLKALVNKVMIRNRRQDTGIEWTKRKVETVFIQTTPEERNLYETVSDFKLDESAAASGFSTLTLQREACSSREAVYYTLQNMMKKMETISEETKVKFQMAAKKIEAVTRNSKAEKVLELIGNSKEKVIIFTEYRATQLYLQWYLQQHGISSVPFRGGFKRGKKDWMKELFQNHAQVLIATEAGGEGINLQFCNILINFDLPWNPMRLEQRIGRVHRLGQKKDVLIYNFAIEGTVEEHILHLLYEKIHLFEKVVGDLDDILTRLAINNIEEYLEDAVGSSRSEGEMKIKMENLSSLIMMAQELKEGQSREAK
ncbi:MAG: DEAD/DEAH box helicase [Bacillus sp. (in: firmicutes)]